MLERLFGGENPARLALLKTLPANAIGVEIGVWKGDFSAQILKHSRPKKLHLVDPWLASGEEDRASIAWYGANNVSQAEMDVLYQKVCNRFSSELKSGCVEVHRQLSVEFMGTLAKDSVDFVYVDGDHSYEGVTADLAEAFRVTKPGGLICADDYFLGAWWKDGVVRAVHELLSAKPVLIHTKLDSQIVLRKLAAQESRESGGSHRGNLAEASPVA